MPVVSVSLPDAELLIQRAKIRLEQYRIALARSPGDMNARSKV